MNNHKIVDIGPQAFADGDEEVINYKGENYYKACGVLVRNLPDGGTSSCIKPINHKTRLHEDYDGNVIYNPDGVLAKLLEEDNARLPLT